MSAAARAHSHSRAHTRTFPGHRTSVADARHWLEDLLARTDRPNIPGETVAAAALLLSEAATNAVLHTASGHHPGGTFTVRLRIGDDTLTVDVQDDGGGVTAVPVAAPTLGAIDGGSDESGRGLVLIGAFADDWGPLPHGRGLYYTLTRRELSDPPAVNP